MDLVPTLLVHLGRASPARVAARTSRQWCHPEAVRAACRRSPIVSRNTSRVPDPSAVSSIRSTSSPHATSRRCGGSMSRQRPSNPSPGTLGSSTKRSAPPATRSPSIRCGNHVSRSAGSTTARQTRSIGWARCRSKRSVQRPSASRSVADVVSRSLSVMVGPPSPSRRGARPAVEPLVPEAAERRQPGVELQQRLRPEPVVAPLGFRPHLHQPGVLEGAQVLGHRGLGQLSSATELADWALGPARRSRIRRRVGSASTSKVVVGMPRTCQIRYIPVKAWTVDAQAVGVPDLGRGRRRTAPPRRR